MRRKSETLRYKESFPIWDFHLSFLVLVHSHLGSWPLKRKQWLIQENKLPLGPPSEFDGQFRAAYFESGIIQHLYLSSSQGCLHIRTEQRMLAITWQFCQWKQNILRCAWQVQAVYKAQTSWVIAIFVSSFLPVSLYKFQLTTRTWPEKKIHMIADWIPQEKGIFIC